MNLLKSLLPPRLREWSEIGPVQRAELEEFAQRLLNSDYTAVTADGVLVRPNQEVWVVSSTGQIMPTSVRETQAVTNYYLFGSIPVSSSFSSRQAAQTYKDTAQ